MTGVEPAPRRADARLNRQHIVDVARSAMAASADASLNSIAQAAGVGPGTLYRHFPDRAALVMAVYRSDVADLVDAAPALLEREPPLRALRSWLEHLARVGRVKHALADVLQAATSTTLHSETYAPVVGALGLLLEACAREGSLRPGLDPDDVLLLMGFLWRIDPGPDRDERVSRMLDLVVDGLRA